MRPVRILLKCLAGLIIAIAAVLIGFDAYIYSLSPDFYNTAKREIPIPGTSTGFIVQDIAYIDEADSWLFSGYKTNDTSPIYRVDSNGEKTELTIELDDGTHYDGHGSGITVNDKYAYLTSEDGYWVLEINDLLQAHDGTIVKAIDYIHVGFDPAFINIVDGKLMCGVYYYAGPYDTPDYMHITTPDGTTNHAIMYAYDPNDTMKYGFDTTPSRVYSIPDKVQGVSLTQDDTIIFSTSWGLAPSALPQYSTNNLVEDGFYQVNGTDVPLYCFDGRSYIDTLVAPPMSEGIILKDGRIWIPNEAASNKYIFGKLYGAGWVYSIAI